MLLLIYNIFFMPMALFAMKLMSFFNSKVKDREDNVWKIISNYKAKRTHRIWFHSASMGEFEQAKPIIEYIKQKKPHIEIIVSFFSPSGYNNQKNYKYADFICYLPFDSPQNVRDFLDIINPTLAVFIRYEIWLNYLNILEERKIPKILITASIPSSQIKKQSFISKYYYKKAFSFFDQIWTIGEQHSEYFNSLELHNEIITFYDTRKDRIANAVIEAQKSPIIKRNQIDARFILVAGSTWSVDEDLLISALNILKSKGIDLLCVFVPHEPNPNHISELQSKLTESILLSEIIDGKTQEIQNHIIVDSIGKLLKLYALADFAYVGGAFGAGLHSVLEPAGYGIPVFCGTNIKSQPDAQEMVKVNALYTISNAKELAERILEIINDKNKLASSQKASFDFIHSAKGSAEILGKSILERMK